MNKPSVTWKWVILYKVINFSKRMKNIKLKFKKVNILIKNNIISFFGYTALNRNALHEMKF